MSRPTQVKRARFYEWLAKVITGGVALFVMGSALAILGYIFWKGIGAISWGFLTGMPEQYMKAGGIFPIIMGTIVLVTATAAIVLPVGIAAGIYLAEYAPKSRWTRLIRLAIANMAGVPSIVYGLFGLAAFVIVMQLNRSIIAGALTLACLTLPVVITATEEALKQIPTDLRQASLALGATRLRTIRKVVLPAAAPGVVTGAILGLARAAGETAPVIFTVAAFYMPVVPKGLDQPAMVLPYHLYAMATQVPNPPQDIVWGTALVLVGGVSLVSALAATWRSFARRRIRW
jgi:phosphate transport system permease protein